MYETLGFESGTIKSFYLWTKYQRNPTQQTILMMMSDNLMMSYNLMMFILDDKLWDCVVGRGLFISLYCSLVFILCSEVPELLGPYGVARNHLIV